MIDRQLRTKTHLRKKATLIAEWCQRIKTRKNQLDLKEDESLLSRKWKPS